MTRPTKSQLAAAEQHDRPLDPVAQARARMMEGLKINNIQLRKRFDDFNPHRRQT